MLETHKSYFRRRFKMPRTHGFKASKEQEKFLEENLYNKFLEKSQSEKLRRVALKGLEMFLRDGILLEIVSSEWGSEKKPSELKSKGKPLPQEAKADMWSEVECIFRIIDVKGNYVCRHKSPPMKPIYPLRPEACKPCQDLQRELMEFDKVVGRFSTVTGRKKVDVAHIVVGQQRELERFQIQLDISNKAHNKTIDKLRTKLSHVGAERDSFKTRLNEYVSLDKDIKEKLAEFENLTTEIQHLEQTISNKKESLEKLETMNEENQAFKIENKAQIEKIRELENEKKKLENQILESSKNPSILCEKKGIVTLPYCYKECMEFIDCGHHETIREKALSLGLL